MICVTYTHRLVEPLRPFTRQVKAMIDGNYKSCVTLRKGDLQLYNEYAEKLNELAKTR